MKRTVSMLFVSACVAVVLGAGAMAAATTPPTTTVPTTPVPSTTTPTGPTVPAPPAPTAVPTTATTTTTTLPPVPPGVFNPDCARVVRPGDSVSLIADQLTPAVATRGLQVENGFGGDHILHAGDVLDVCVGNDVNDINGASRLRPATTLIPDADPSVIMVQQQKLNELFGPYGMTPLTVDGISGPLTRQQLCAARVFLGLPISRSDMAAGSPEEAALLALTSLPVPPGAPTDGHRWALLDMSCQVLIAGEGTAGVRFVFPTSTGEPEYPTRAILEADTFRFDPALENGGWHDSSEYPASYDNPLNGNMYKPLYFNDGQAMHGASHVPTRPASKGCARLTVANQDHLIGWLGLGDATGPVWRESVIDLTVTVQGEYLPDP